MAEPAPERPPGGSLRVALLGNVAGHPWVNRFWCHCTYPTTPTAAQVLALSNEISSQWRLSFNATLNTQTHLTSQRTVLYVDNTLSIGVDGSDAGTGAGGAASQVPGSCYLINWTIQGTYRGGHPRTYLPGPVDGAASVAGVVTDPNRTAITTGAENFLANVNSFVPPGFTSVRLGTIAFFRNHTALTPPVFEPFLTGACHPNLASQRRRNRT